MKMVGRPVWLGRGLIAAVIQETCMCSRGTLVQGPHEP